MLNLILSFCRGRKTGSDISAPYDAIIGLNGALPYHHRDDLKFFKTTTTNSDPNLINILICGKNTQSGLPMLGGRHVLVLMGDLNTILDLPNHRLNARYRDEFNTIWPGKTPGDVFIIGGAKVFTHVLNNYQHLVDHIFVNIVTEPIVEYINDGTVAKFAPELLAKFHAITTMHQHGLILQKYIYTGTAKPIGETLMELGDGILQHPLMTGTRQPAAAAASESVPSATASLAAATGLISPESFKLAAPVTVAPLTTLPAASWSFTGLGGYEKLVQMLLDYGETRTDRTGTGTKSHFHAVLEYDLSDGTIPLITTRFTSFRSILLELLWFIRGDTDSKRLEADNVNIWKGNSSREFLDRTGLNYPEGLIGPMYGYQWRNYGAKYDTVAAKANPITAPGDGLDQFRYVLDLIKNDPMSRRILMTTYHPIMAAESVLYPCHGIVMQFYVTGDRLDASVYNRSQDVMLGVPFNIASYAILLRVFAMKSGKTAGMLTIIMGDAHIYLNHVEGAREQITRECKPFPTLELSDLTDIDWSEMDPTMFRLESYHHGGVMKYQMSV